MFDLIIPVGFRCYTKQEIYKRYQYESASMPFDHGFFSPFSIASVLKDPHVDLSNHSVCIKCEKVTDAAGYIIKFSTSNYNEIDTLTLHDSANLNKYVDTTISYYTLDKKHKYILAHYNYADWSPLYNGGCDIDRSEMIEHINDIMNRRIKRMIDQCKKANSINFVYYENQGYEYLNIDDYYYSLTDISDISKAVYDRFGIRAVVTHF